MAGRRLQSYFEPVDSVIISMTWSMLKLAGFWRGGNYLKVARKFATYAWAGTRKKIRSIIQS